MELMSYKLVLAHDGVSLGIRLIYPHCFDLYFSAISSLFLQAGF